MDSALLLGALAARGLREVVVSPGSRSAPLVLSALDHPELTVRVVLDERVAGFVALGLSRAGGRPVALVCTSGSAAAHYLPALVEADASRLPLLVLTADRPPELHGCGAPQTVDQRRYFGAFVRGARDLCGPMPDAAWVQAAVAAVDLATGIPAGPVHLNVAFREPLWDPEADGQVRRPSAQVGAVRGAPRLESSAIAELTDRLRSAGRGVVFCGPGAGVSASGVRRLADHLGWPLLAEAASGTRFGAPPGGVVWSYDALVRAGAPAPDLVLQFGRAAVSRPLLRWLSGGPCVRVDAAGARHDPALAGGVLVAADPEHLARDLADALGAAPADDRWRAAWMAAQTRVAALVSAADAELWEGAVARAVVAALPLGHALHVASSMPFRDVDAFVPAAGRALPVFASRGANGIDGTIATAAGESLGRGPVALLTGDLAFLHDVGGLLAAAELGADLTVVVIDNGGGGIFDFLPIAAHPTAFERCFTTPQRGRIDALCAAAGASHTRVEDVHELRPALSAALGRPGLDVVQIIIERHRNVARHHELTAACEAALSEECPWSPSSTG